MHPKRVTPTRVIINAIRVGILTWFGIFILRLLSYFEPAMVDGLCRLAHVEPYCSLHGWHTFAQSWYGTALDTFHPVIMLAAAALSAIRDLLEARFL
jgi:hypothetical protein